jgi:hypothetical protein
MPRTAYANGDTIELGACNGCNPARINGVLCHETGCPDAWRDRARDCFQCGCDFLPESRFQSVCSDCANPEPLEVESC